MKSKEILFLKLTMIMIIIVVATGVTIFRSLESWNVTTSLTGTRALNIANMINLNLDIEKYQELMKTGDRDDEYYIYFREYMDQLIRDTKVTYAYIMAYSDGNNYVFFIEGDHIFSNSKEPLTLLLDLDTVNNYDPLVREVLRTGENRYTDDYKVEGWERVVSGLSPVLNENGNVIGVISVDICLEDEYRAAIVNAVISTIVICIINSIVYFFFLSIYDKKLKSMMLSQINLDDLKSYLLNITSKDE